MNRKENWLNINSWTRIHYKVSIIDCTLIRTWGKNILPPYRIYGKKKQISNDACIDDTVEMWI